MTDGKHKKICENSFEYSTPLGRDIAGVRSGSESAGIFYAFCCGMADCNVGQSTGAFFREKGKAGPEAWFRIDCGDGAGVGDGVGIFFGVSSSESGFWPGKGSPGNVYHSFYGT